MPERTTSWLNSARQVEHRRARRSERGSVSGSRENATVLKNDRYFQLEIDRLSYSCIQFLETLNEQAGCIEDTARVALTPCKFDEEREFRSLVYRLSSVGARFDVYSSIAARPASVIIIRTTLSCRRPVATVSIAAVA
jgi:hypothetical protein